MLYSSNSANLILGAICNDCSLALNDKLPLDKADFEPNQFQKIIYITLYNLAIKGVKEASEVEICEFLKDYQAQYNIFDENNGIEYIRTIKQLGKIDNYEYYWSIIRKFSLLRAYKGANFDISELYDENKAEDKENAKLNNLSLDDIVNHFEGKQANIKRQFLINHNIEEYQAGKDFLETKERFKSSPLVGNSFQSPYLNAIFRGIYGFILRVAKSGGGKTVTSIGDLCKTTITEYYDTKLKKFVKNKSRAGAGLFINTEMDLRNEIDPIIIAWISGVSRGHIMDGKYDEGEEERVDYAAKVLKESELYIVDDPHFTTNSLITTIKDYALNKNVKTVCFDYIQNNGAVAKEISSETKVAQREDMVLLALTDRLKQVQRDCDISLISSVQTNGQEDNMETPTESCLAGGKSQVRKTDGTMIMLPPKKSELEQTKALRFKQGFEPSLEPNNVVHIIKGRANKYKRHIKVFQYVDLGTARSVDLYCTNQYNEPIDVEKFIIEN